MVKNFHFKTLALYLLCFPHNSPPNSYLLKKTPLFLVKCPSTNTIVGPPSGYWVPSPKNLKAYAPCIPKVKYYHLASTSRHMWEKCGIWILIHVLKNLRLACANYFNHILGDDISLIHLVDDPQFSTCLICTSTILLTNTIERMVVLSNNN